MTAVKETPGVRISGVVMAPVSSTAIVTSLKPAWNKLVVDRLTQYHEATALAYRRDLVAWIRFTNSGGLTMETATGFCDP